jgi:hypothetical protein
MNRQVDLGRRLAEHFGSEAPRQAPDWVLADALTTINDTRQRRVLIPALWRFPTMKSFSKLVVAAGAVVAIGIIGLNLLGPGPGPGGPTTAPTSRPTAAPTSAPTSAPVVTAAPTQSTSGAFRPAFTFLFPTGPTFDYGTVNETYFEVRIPEYSEAGYAAGIIIQATGGGRADPCDGTSAALPIAPGPEATMVYLKSIPGVTVIGEQATTVSGLPARHAIVVWTPGPADCAEVWLWANDLESFSGIPPGVILRMLAVDVGSEHVMITTFGEATNTGWDGLVDQFIAGMVFTE